MITISSVSAQNKFGQLLDEAQREPILITRHGRPAAYIISPQDMKVLQETQSHRRNSQPDWGEACAAGWNEFDSSHGSFADEHSTL
ncbi:type II toxin-antitoxin system Phd/YefM family antitoxin [Variovorax robiniae]|uniref:Antitoxin n=1 Tax=Variovorax robiniae TaxID=1836199 RepID=A0ABU8X9J0_9BURK